MAAKIIHGDCITELSALPADSVDAIVTDPPYGLGFMGKQWDALPPGREWADECLRVLKPGGHLLAFGGTRTWHRLAVAVEDAGFEIRDSIAWLYGSGFPKSMDVSKAIDKRPGVTRHAEFAAHLAERREAAGLSRQDVSEKVVGTRSGACWNWEHHQFPEARWWPPLRDLLSLDEAWGSVVEEAERQKVGTRTVGRLAVAPGQGADRSAVELDVTEHATDAARQWQGWGTALKPAFEPIVVARKPLDAGNGRGTVAANVLEHGTGALNIDGCRIGMTDEDRAVVDKRSGAGSPKQYDGWGNVGAYEEGRRFTSNPSGRWPANVILDEDQAAALDEQSGPLHTQRPTNPSTMKSSHFGGGTESTSSDRQTCAKLDQDLALATPAVRTNQPRQNHYDDNGASGASRFFYVAKAPKKERPTVDGVAHPTVKPLTLMRWLVRLVTPPGGVVLDPFAGSGTTVEAALLEGFDVVGIERETDYLPLINARIARAKEAA